VRFDRHWSLFAALAACAPHNPVAYVSGQCLIGGVPASLAQVEARQAELTQHILSRQPVLTAIAIAAVCVAGGGYLQKIVTMLWRRGHVQPSPEQLRAREERSRAHGVRKFFLISAALAVIAAAGIIYVSLDSDKRTSERSLATLQFCHLALRSASEQHTLAEQREHLAAIQASEHDIRALVDKLPPAEQQKAREIAGQLSVSLGQERTMVSQLAERADTSAKAVADGQATLARGLSKLDDEVVDLKSMPAAVAKLGGDVQTVGTRVDAAANLLDSELDACNAKLDALGKSIDALAAEPPPACTCTSVAAPVAAPTPPEPPPTKSAATVPEKVSPAKSPAVTPSVPSGSGSAA
jgi:hypothetical protein